MLLRVEVQLVLGGVLLVEQWVGRTLTSLQVELLEGALVSPRVPPVSIVEGLEFALALEVVLPGQAKVLFSERALQVRREIVRGLPSLVHHFSIIQPFQNQVKPYLLGKKVDLCHIRAEYERVSLPYS